MQRRDLLKLMTGLPAGAAVAGNLDAPDGLNDLEELAFPTDTVSENNQHKLLYLHPGEISFLLGRPKNGKTTLAMSIALDYAMRGLNVWFFSMGRESRDIAAMMGLELKQFQDGTEEVMRERHFHTYADGRRISITFFDHFWGTHTPLTQVPRAAADYTLEQPRLVIYDGDTLDTTTLTDIEEHTMATDLQQRRVECAHVFKAPIIISMAMPGGAALEREDKRPLESELKPRRVRRPTQSLVDELYFVHRQALYEDEWDIDKLDAIELTRVNRLRPENHTRLLVKDTQTQRLRNLNHEEVEQLLTESNTRHA
jgi:hypothetical protein